MNLNDSPKIALPVVTYHHLLDGTTLNVGRCVYVAGIKNHPTLGDREPTKLVLTSPIVAVHDEPNGVFETLNTRYVPESPHHSG